MHITLRQVRYFIAVAEAGSITGAAVAISISQSAITEALKALQAQVGVTLLERRARGVALTQQGHQFLRHARTIVSAVTDAQLAIHTEPETFAGHLNLGTTHLVAGYLLAEPLARFSRIYPDVSYNVVEDGRRYIEHQLINGELDIGAVILSNIEDPSPFETRVLIRSRHRLWLPSSHPLGGRDDIRFEDIAEERLIFLVADEYRSMTSAVWQHAGAVPVPHITTASVEAVRGLVATGTGVAVLPDIFYRPWSLEGDRIDARHMVDPTPTFDIGLIWRRGSTLAAPARLFRDLILEAYQ